MSLGELASVFSVSSILVELQRWVVAADVRRLTLPNLAATRVCRSEPPHVGCYRQVFNFDRIFVKLFL
jgi:hypothetical protein